MIPKELIAILVLWGFLSSCKAQQVFRENLASGQFSVSANIMYGTILKHTPKFLPELEKNSVIIEYSFQNQTRGKKYWQQTHFFPEVGFSFLYADYRNEVLGRGYALMPHIKQNFFRTKNLWVFYRLGCGLALISNFYDLTENPMNTVIGSRINMIIHLNPGIEWKLTPKLAFQVSGGFTHFSNGNVRFPNLGINIFTGNTGMKLTLGDAKKLNAKPVTNHPLQNRQDLVHWDFEAGFAFNETKVADGPTYFSPVAGISFSRKIAGANYFISGMKTVFNQRDYAYAKFQENIQHHPFLESFDVGIMIGDEFLFNRIGFSVALGYYIYNPFLKPNAVFSELGMKYYHPLGKHTTKKLFACLTLRSHLIRAYYVSTTLGIRF